MFSFSFIIYKMESAKAPLLDGPGLLVCITSPDEGFIFHVGQLRDVIFVVRLSAK